MKAAAPGGPRRVCEATVAGGGSGGVAAAVVPLPRPGARSPGGPGGPAGTPRWGQAVPPRLEVASRLPPVLRVSLKIFGGRFCRPEPPRKNP